MAEEITVAVIGAGAAGLNALKVLNHNPKDAQTTFRATAFEQTDRVGGTWVYTDCVGTDEMGLPVHSSIYKNLRTNLPKEVMAYPDYPFPSQPLSYVPHEDVLKYLEDYTTDFGLLEYIKFKTIVENVKPVPDDNTKFGVKWEVTTADVTSRKEKQTQLFDAVLVCNGHYSIPYMPVVPGLETFEGDVLHSHDYRHPETYKEKRVLVFGGKLSGMDIACELAEVASKVYLSHKNPSIANLADHIDQRPCIKCCQKQTVVFTDDSVVDVDAIILCTGYKYEFPFLDDSVKVRVEEGRVTPLFKHFLSIDFPSLGFIGLLKANLPFPHFHTQICCFKSIMEGTATLPSKEDMFKEEEEEFNSLISPDFPPRYFHSLGDKKFQYLTDLADLGHFEKIPPVMIDMFKVSAANLRSNFKNHKNFNFVVSDDKTDFEVVLI